MQKEAIPVTHEDGTQILPQKTPETPARVIEVDACGLSCPGPLMKLKANMDTLAPGDVLHIRASDPGFYPDVQAWARRTGAEILSLTKSGGLVDVQLGGTATVSPFRPPPRRPVMRQRTRRWSSSGDPITC